MLCSVFIPEETSADRCSVSLSEQCSILGPRRLWPHMNFEHIKGTCEWAKEKWRLDAHVDMVKYAFHFVIQVVQQFISQPLYNFPFSFISLIIVVDLDIYLVGLILA